MKDEELKIKEYIKQRNKEYTNELIICGMRNAVIILLNIIGVSNVFGVQIESVTALIVTSITAGFLSYLSTSMSILKLEESINKDKIKMLESLYVLDIAFEKICNIIECEDVLEESIREFEKIKKEMEL